MTKLEAFSIFMPLFGFFTGGYLLCTKYYDPVEEFSFGLMMAIVQGIELGLIIGYLFL